MAYMTALYSEDYGFNINVSVCKRSSTLLLCSIRLYLDHTLVTELRLRWFNLGILSVSLVGLSGLEPPTSRLSGVRSNRLSYKPISFDYLKPMSEYFRILWWR